MWIDNKIKIKQNKKHSALCRYYAISLKIGKTVLLNCCHCENNVIILFTILI